MNCNKGRHRRLSGFDELDFVLDAHLTARAERRMLFEGEKKRDESSGLSRTLDQNGPNRTHDVAACYGAVMPCQYQ